MSERSRGRDALSVAAIVTEACEPARERDCDGSRLPGALDLDAREEARVLFRAERDVGADLLPVESGHDPQDSRTYGGGQEIDLDALDVCTSRVHSGPMRETSSERSERKPLPMSAAEKRLMEAAARVSGLPWAQWARTVLLPAAREALAKAGAR